MKRSATNQVFLCCTDTGPEKDLNLKDVDSLDRRRGYFGCTFHLVLKRDGEFEYGRKLDEPAMGLGRFNGDSLSVCLVGGRGEPPFTRPQLAALQDLLAELKDEYPDASIHYHHEADRKVAHHGLDLVALAKDLKP